MAGKALTSLYLCCTLRPPSAIVTVTASLFSRRPWSDLLWCSSSGLSCGHGQNGQCLLHSDSVLRLPNHPLLMAHSRSSQRAPRSTVHGGTRRCTLFEDHSQTQALSLSQNGSGRHACFVSMNCHVARYYHSHRMLLLLLVLARETWGGRGEPSHYLLHL